MANGFIMAVKVNFATNGNVIKEIYSREIKFQSNSFYVVQAHPMYVLRFQFLAIHTA
jgi:hypothetical protein